MSENGGQEICFGLHAVQAAIQYDSTTVTEIYVDKSRHDKRFKDLLRRLEKCDSAIQRVDRQELDQLAQSDGHQGVVIFVKGAAAKGEKELASWLDNQSEELLLLILDGVQDPHNLGACLRSAEASGCDAVIAPRNRAVGLTPVVHKVSCGASQRVPFFQVTNLSRTLQQLKDRNIWLVGAAGEAEQTLYQVDMKGSLAIVMGAEGEGLRRLTREECDFLAKIPMAGKVESLNVSVATGIFLFEALRQRSS